MVAVTVDTTDRNNKYVQLEKGKKVLKKTQKSDFFGKKLIFAHFTAEKK